MTAPTQPVTINIADFGGPAVAGIVVTARLSDVDYTEDGTFVSTKPVTGTTNSSGITVLQLFPNAVAPDGLGTRNTTVIITAFPPASRPINVEAVIPDAPCNLADVLVNDTALDTVAYIPPTQLADYAALRAYAGHRTAVYVTGYLVSAAPSGIAGLFIRDDTDTTSADNGGTILVSATGKRWKRVFEGALHTSWFGTKGNGTTNDYAALLAAIAGTPDGGTLAVDGLVRITTPLVITRRVSLWCESAGHAIVVDVGTGNDGVTFQGPGGGINGLNVNLNVYGPVNACRNALVLSRVDRSTIRTSIHAGAAQYAAVLDGCLINTIYIDSSTNFVTPYGAAGFQVDHVLARINATYGVATNANFVRVNLEGGRNGLVATANMAEGENVWEGCIEGLSGRPVDFSSCSGQVFENLWIEANALGPRCYDCRNVRVRAVTLTSLAAAGDASWFWSFENCLNVNVDAITYGQAKFDALCSGVQYGGEVVSNPYDQPARTSWGDSAETVRPIMSIGTSVLSWGGDGMASLENQFINPLMDLWSAGTTNPPDGFVGTNYTAIRGTGGAGGPFPQANGYTADINQSVAGFANGPTMRLYSPQGPWAQDRWVSFMLAVYIPVGQPNLLVYLCDDALAVTSELVARVTTKGSWQVIRAGGKIPAGAIPAVHLTCNDGVNMVTGIYSVGGFAMVNGPRAPKYLGDHIRRNLPWVDVRWFGAKGDGVTDDTAAFTAAQNARLNVRIPAGTFVLNNFRPKSGLRLVGSGKDVTFIKQGAAGNYAINCLSDASVGQLLGNELSGFTVLGAAAATQYAVNVEANGVYAITHGVFDFKCQNTYGPLRIDCVTAAAVYDCDFRLVSATSSTGASIMGAYNRFDLFITNVANSLICTDATNDSTFHRLVGEGLVRFNGQRNTYDNVVCESIPNAATPDDTAFRIAAAGSTFRNLSVLTAASAKASVAVSIFAADVTIDSLSIIGPGAGVSPSYPISFSAGSSGTIGNIRSDCLFKIDQYTDAATLAKWGFTGDVTQAFSTGFIPNSTFVDVRWLGAKGDGVDR
jgi:hypothetical protein